MDVGGDGRLINAVSDAAEPALGRLFRHAFGVRFRSRVRFFVKRRPFRRSDLR